MPGLCAIMLAMMMHTQGQNGFTLRSAAFAPDAGIPPVHTCDGADTSPPLEWSGAPAGTKAFALIVHDPDAPRGDYLHWTAWNIPAGMHGLPEGIPKKESLPDGTRQGRNDDGKPGYGGPCPPSGTHHYVFEFYALDATLSLPSDATRDQIEKEIRVHQISKAQVIGTYQRKKS
jgi:Raf kinase inhibitor-like YbhB/YbcL family protein